MLKSSRTIWIGLVLLTIVSLVLTACGGGAAPATPAPQPTQAPAEKPADAPKPSGKTTSSGFECPEPQNKVDVKSTELNLFVWTEYIPQDAIECFELIYGVKVNRKEYSSNEEMYATLSAGSSTYDLVQPTDYIVRPDDPPGPAAETRQAPAARAGSRWIRTISICPSIRTMNTPFRIRRAPTPSCTTQTP